MPERDSLQIGKCLAGTNLAQRSSVVTRKPPPDLLEEPRLVGIESRLRQRQDQLGYVDCAVLRDGEQEQRKRAARVVVESAEQSEVNESQTAVGREQDVAAVRIGVVRTLHRHLAHVCAEELARELLRSSSGEAVIRSDLLSLDPLEHEHPLGYVGPEALRDNEILVVGEKARDHLGVVRFLDEVEFPPQVLLELVRECSRLQELCPFGSPLEHLGRPAEKGQVEPICSSIARRRTLTITSRPLSSSVVCTCAIEAVASGSGSTRTNTPAGRSSSITRSISGKKTGGTWSTSLPSSAM